MAEDENKNPWTTRKQTLRYETPWIRVIENDVIDPSGREALYGTVHFQNVGVGVLPIDAEGFTWLVGQYRFPINRYSWEIPEGGAKLTEDPLVAAKRELEEETGLYAKRWEKWFEMYLSNSVTDERAVVYIARELSEGIAHPEPTEKLTVRRIQLSEAYAMCTRGEIFDSVSVAALWRARAEGIC